MKLDDIKPNPINPRTITDADLQELDESMEEFGDLSGFVFNHDGTIISAHQRWKKIQDRVKEFVVSETFKTPLPDGTIQRGHFELTDGRKYDYSVRKWPQDKADRATIRANRRNAGQWDREILQEWKYEREELIEAGVPEWVFGGDDPDEVDYSDKNKELNTGSFLDEMEMKFKFSKDDFMDVQERLNVVCSKQNVETKEDALRELLMFYERHGS